MKPLILVAAVAAFEFAFLASIATPPSAAEQVSAARSQPASRQLAQGSGAPVPCAPPG